MSRVSPTLGDMLESYFHKRLVSQQQASIDTIHGYRDALRLLIVFAAEQANIVPEQLTIHELDRDVVLAFLDHLEIVRYNCIRTRNTRLAAIRAFMQYAAYMDPSALGVVQRVLAIPNKRCIKPILGYLTREELDILLSMPDQATRQGRRDYCLLLFLARTGARVSEAIKVNAVDIKLNPPYQVLLHGKGMRDRMTPIAPDLAIVLRSLYEERQITISDNVPVFVSTTGQRLTRYGVTHVLRRTVAAAANLDSGAAERKITPHTLRHTKAMHMLQDGVDLNMIRCWLGHISLDTTHHYIEADVEMKRRVLEQSGIVEPQQAYYKPTDKILAMLESL